MTLCLISTDSRPSKECMASMGVFFVVPDRVIPVTKKLVSQWLPCQAPGVIGFELRLVGPISVYCEWVR